MTVNTLHIDGLPVFWIDTGERFEATLVFRGGIADEDLRRRGTAELVHRAVLTAADPDGNEITGEVDLLTSSFTCAGTPEEVTERLHRIVDAIAAVDRSAQIALEQLVRSDRERRPVAEQLLLRARFGNVGVGVAPAPRLLLQDPAAVDTATAWARRHLHRDNAVLVLTGPPPPGLRLRLAPGRRVPAIRPEPRRRPLPAWTVGDEGVVGLSLLGAPTLAFLAAVDVLVDSCNRHTGDRRTFDGVALGFSRLGPTTLQALVLAQGICGPTQRVLDSMTTALDRVTLHGLPVARTRELVQQLHARIVDPLATVALVRQAAIDWLLGAPPRRRQEHILELACLTDHVVADTLWHLRSTAVWIAPPDLAPDRRVSPVEDWTEQCVPGTTFEQVYREPDEPRRSVVAGPAGITLRVEHRGNLTVWWRDCVLVTVDVVGRWRFHGADGTVVEVSTSRFRGPVPFADVIPTWVPPELVVRLEDDRVRARPHA